MDSSKLLSLLFVGGTALLGGCFSRADIVTILKTEFTNNKSCLSKELALKLMLLGIKKGNANYLSNHSDIDTKRRENINNTDTYEEISQETLNQ